MEDQEERGDLFYSNEPIEAWRAYWVGSNALYPIAFVDAARYETNHTYQAKCYTGIVSSKLCWDADLAFFCNGECGFYARKDPEAVIDYVLQYMGRSTQLPVPDIAIGPVRLQGTVKEHTLGYRATSMEVLTPTKVIVHNGESRRIYGLPEVATKHVTVFRHPTGGSNRAEWQSIPRALLDWNNYTKEDPWKSESLSERSRSSQSDLILKNVQLHDVILPGGNVKKSQPKYTFDWSGRQARKTVTMKMSDEVAQRIWNLFQEHYTQPEENE